MYSKAWDMTNVELTVNGQTYFVNADFKFSRQAVGYDFDSRRGCAGQGRDLMADVVDSIAEIEIFGPDEVNESVTLADVGAIRAATLKAARESSEGERNVQWDRWA